MAQRNSGAFKGIARKAVWLFIVACLESILTAFPTITLYSREPSTGILVEGITLTAPDVFPRHDTDAPERQPADLTDTSWYSRLVEESAAAAVPQNFRRTGAPGSETDLLDIDADWKRPAMMSTWTTADLRSTSNSFGRVKTVYSSDGPFPVSPRRPAPYR